MKPAIGGSQRQRRENVAFPHAANAQQAVLRLLIGRACVPGHPYLAVMGARETGQQIELVGTEIQYLLFDGGGLGGVRTCVLQRLVSPKRRPDIDGPLHRVEHDQRRPLLSVTTIPVALKYLPSKRVPIGNLNVLEWHTVNRFSCQNPKSPPSPLHISRNRRDATPAPSATSTSAAPLSSNAPAVPTAPASNPISR